jgi:hypothetical protein
MIQHANVFVQRARKTDLHFLVSFLTFAQSKESGLQKLHHALVADMIQHATEYAQRARKTALGDLATFLIYTKSTESGLQKLNHALVADMTQHATEFAQRARKTDLHFLITFLAYAKSRENGLLKLHNTLVADMVQHATEFIGRAREAAFGVLVAFLTYTKSKQNGLLKLHDTLVADMIQHATEFAERARKTAFGELVNLLTYTKSAENGLLNFHDTLIVDMVQHATEFADHACEVPINQLVTFLTYVRSEFRDSRIASAKDFAQDVCDAIDLKAWNYRRANERPQQPNFVLNTKRLLTELGRAELLFPVARNLIRAADQRAWHGPAIGIHHLSSIMQESAHQERDHLVRFLDRIVLPEWLDRNYSQANQGSLAASWFAIATNLPCEFHSRFVTPGLQARLDQDLAAALFESTDIGTNVFSMIGSAALLGATPNSSDIRWPNSQILDQMMKLRRSTDETLNSRQMQFWCGLREMARLQTDAVKVPCSEARPILVSWKNLSPRTPFAIAFNASMIAWLETSEASNWNLARCNEQVRDDIIARICEA